MSSSADHSYSLKLSFPNLQNATLFCFFSKLFNHSLIFIILPSSTYPLNVNVFQGSTVGPFLYVFILPRQHPLLLWLPPLLYQSEWARLCCSSKQFPNIRGLSQQLFLAHNTCPKQVIKEHLFMIVTKRPRLVKDPFQHHFHSQQQREENVANHTPAS